MKIVLDTNVIISAFATRGLCHSLFEICIDRFDILLSNEILKEVESNLVKKLKLAPHLISDIEEYLHDTIQINDINSSIIDICRDPDDDKIPGLAKKSSVDFIITGDKDLLALKKFDTIQIVTPREFWEIVKRKDEN